MATARTAYRPRGDMVCVEGEGKEVERGRIGVTVGPNNGTAQLQQNKCMLTKSPAMNTPLGKSKRFR